MYKYTHLIPENIAPIGAKSIGIYDSNGRRVGGFGLGRLAPSLTVADKLYSFAALSDPHIPRETASTDFQRALTFAENNCDFTCICGDLTVNGTDSELDQYKHIVDTYAKTKPVYEMAGNHENYDIRNVFEQSVGKPLYYTISNHETNTENRNYYNEHIGDDVFIMVGHAGGYRGDGIGWKSDEFVTKDELQWLYETLEANRNKRCFVFNHVYPYEDGVGDANRLYGGKQWSTKDGGIGQAFISLLKHYKNTVLFHGHSHLRFHLQELDKKANYSSDVGYRSVHIPSLSIPRDLVNNTTGYVFAESEGYIVDVYENCIILNGRDFIDNDADGHGLGIATYKIDTTLQTIAANTFTDSTGTIIT